ncbi:MAG: hypothetical protein ACFFEN_04200 [Candidatus Thorarchaeota archaeon]
MGKDEIEQISIKSDKLKSTEKMIELDFKYFNFFISDYKDIRIVFILKEKASEQFKNRTAEFLSSIDAIASDKLKAWNGDLKVFNTSIPPLLEKHFHLYYRKEFKINPVINILQLLKEEEFSKMERRLINVIVSMTKEQENFYLQDAVETVHEKNHDKVIEALEALIEKQILISSFQRILK